ncbi:MAG: ABC transporter ATP-binding protein, partial [Comamonadaceae bacterium]
AVQVGAADALFERPQHTFVGHFIGSPGMNFLPATVQDGQLSVAGQRLAQQPGRSLPDGALKVGVRPEYLAIAAAAQDGALPAVVDKVQDVGTYALLTARVGEHVLKARLGVHGPLPSPGDTVWLQVLGPHTCYYRDEELLA